MKKRFIAGGCILLIALASLGYYLAVVSSTGNASIYYIEPEDAYPTFSSIINHPKLKGKVLYVDYWHTGCSPCLREFEHLVTLKEQFKDNNDLIFLYLGKDRSVPGEKFRWKRMIEKKDVTGVHYFVGDEQFYNLWKETVKDTSITPAFPHHLIVNRRGQIVSENAPGPYDTKLVELLSEVLKTSDPR